MTLHHTYKWAKVKRIVKVRDKGCVICRTRNSLQVHHLRDASNHPELFYDLNNLVCVCDTCHAIFHNRYKGSYRKKTTKVDFKRFKNIINYGKKLNKKQLK